MFERNEIIVQNSVSNYVKFKFTTSPERVVEYYENTTSERREVTESLLRAVSREAFYKEVNLKSPVKFSNVLATIENAPKVSSAQ